MNARQINWILLPIEATLAPLENNAVIHQGWSPRCDSDASPSENIWGVLKTTAIQDGQFLSEYNKVLPPHLSPKTNLEVKNGDLLLTCAGPRIRCGITCLIRHTRPKLILSGKMYRFRPNEELIDARILEAFLRAPETRAKIDAMKTGISESGMNITREKFATLNVPIPPKNEQKRIADKLDATLARVDACRERLARVAPILKRFRQSVLAAAVSGRLTADWRAQQAGGDNIPLTTESPDHPAVIEPASGNQAQTRSPDAARWNPGNNAAIPSGINPDFGADAPVSGLLTEEIQIADIQEPYSHQVKAPISWRKSTIGEEVEIIGGSQPPKSEFRSEPGPNFIRLIQIRDYKSDKYATYIPITLAKRFCDKSDVMIGRYGPPIFQILRGLEGAYNVALMKAKPKTSNLDLNYLYYFLKVDSLLKYVESGSDRTAGQDGVRKELLTPYPMFIPPLTEQHEIVRRVESLFAFADRLEARLAAAQTAAEQLTPALLAKAFRGELVPQDPADEPASELLQRLAASRASADNPKRSRTPRQPA